MAHERFEECEDCDGTGFLNISDCCGGTLYGEEPDYICGECKDHCTNAVCDACDGKGFIEGMFENTGPDTWAEYNGDK